MNLDISKLRDIKNKKDFDSIKELCMQLYPNRIPLIYEDYKKVLSNNKVNIYVLRIDGKILGMASLVLYQKLGGNVALIEDVIMDKNLQEKGFGRTLMKRLLKESKSFECQCVDVNTRREGTRDFYKRIGFFEKNKERPLYSLRYKLE
jgi:N-acetylglutamate synthase-like GNAT family acetyltransferase